MSSNLENSRIIMQRAVLQPFPPLVTTPRSSLSELQRLDTLIQNLEAHHRSVKAALLATSVSTLSTLHTGHPATASTTDPRLANRIAHPAQPIHSDSEDALLASLTTSSKGGRANSGPHVVAIPRTEDKFLAELGTALEQLRGYERGSTGVVDGLKAERERVREKERVEQMGKEGGYDRERDPRLRR